MQYGNEPLGDATAAPRPPADIDRTLPSRHLVRLLRAQPDRLGHDTVMPESLLWRAFCELSRRGVDDAPVYFVRSMKTLLRRRNLNATDLPMHDEWPDEHKMVDDPLLGELFKAYKRCIQNHRTGPASQLLNDIATQLGVVETA